MKIKYKVNKYNNKVYNKILSSLNVKLLKKSKIVLFLIRKPYLKNYIKILVKLMIN